jgi:hypothetical protein
MAQEHQTTPFIAVFEDFRAAWAASSGRSAGYTDSRQNEGGFKGWFYRIFGTRKVFSSK